MDDELDELDPQANPYPPGSEDWHRYNLGISPGVIGMVETIELSPDGFVINGWFFGKLPPTLAGWYVDPQTNEAKLIKE